MNDLVQALVAEGEAETPLGISTAYRSASFDGETARAAAEQLQRRPDASALQLLLALRREAPDTYRQVPAELRAQVLVGALRDLPFLNDFGWMEPDGHGHRRGDRIRFLRPRLPAEGRGQPEARGRSPGAVGRLGREALSKGVLTASAGNMAQGVAWRARELGVPCTVVAPETAPETKVKAVERLGLGGDIQRITHLIVASCT